MKALVIVDMQNDFIDGSLGTKEAAAIVPAVAERIKNSSDELVLFTADTHGEDYLSTPEGKKLPVVHCVKGTDGWEIHEDVLTAAENAITFEKPVFGSTALVDFLKGKEQELTRIELLGLCTDICVISNAIMLKNAMPNIEIYVNEKCCAGVTPQSHKEAINVMKMCQINII
ncbi:MAG: cysteine hydrolase [Defluviitaleaceae bacterium]|nr:cysteine hydrolase [Defluviitaleaceae bacterium]